MKKVLFILPSRDFNDLLYLNTHQVLEDRGYEIINVSNESGICSGASGTSIDCGVIESIDSSQIDALVLVGGYGIELLSEDPAVIQFVQNVFDQGKIIAAIELGPLLLAKADILGGRIATVLPKQEYVEKLKKSGARISSETVEVDGNIITAADEQSVQQFASAIANALEA